MLPEPASKLQFVVVREIDADLATVFDAVTSEAGMMAWVPLCRSAQWLHPAGSNAVGVNSVRHILLHGGVVAAERIVGWEPGRELQYTFDQTTLPIAQFTRDYVGVTRVDAISAGRTRLTWSVHFDGAALPVLLEPVVRAFLKPLITAMAGRLKRAAEAQGT